MPAKGRIAEKALKKIWPEKWWQIDRSKKSISTNSKFCQRGGDHCNGYEPSIPKWY
jgi:hypothetical protein